MEQSSVTRLMQTSSRFFEMLDRTDPIQAEISRRLWVLRSTVLFTLLPFDDPGLDLLLQVNELEQSSLSIPDAIPMIESLRKCITDICNVGRNPKREWFIHMLAENAGDENGKIGIFTALSSGRSPGWPYEKLAMLSELDERLLPVMSRKDLKNNIYQMLIFPCGCSNVPHSFLSDLLFSGITAKIDVLLYSAEKLQVPKRLTLPNDSILSSRLEISKMDREIVVVPNDVGVSAVDTWVNEAFWQGVHGAARRGSHDLSPARYMLFCDGTGTFLPEDGHVTTLSMQGRVISEDDLDVRRVEDISEGDLVVLRSGYSGLLLDDASERILGREENDNLFDVATDWKNALDALLVTHTAEEVARELQERGVTTSAVSIYQWAGPDVLGPGNERVFNELINLLADKGKIKKSGAELTNYAFNCWQGLQAFRGLHHKAGKLIRQDLFKALFSRYGSGKEHDKLPDRESIHIDGNSGVELLILRVSSVDNNTAYIQPSRFGKMDDLKGNKWLG